MMKKILVLLFLLATVTTAQETAIRITKPGITSGTANTWSALQKFPDDMFEIIGSVDATKILRFEVDGFTTATTRTITVPNTSFIAAGTNIADQAWSARQSFENNVLVTGVGKYLMFGGGATEPLLIGQNNSQSPTAFTISVDNSTSRSLLLVERTDEGFNFAHALQTNPTLFIHSAAQSTTQWLGLSHDGSSGKISSGTGTIDLGAQISAGIITAATYVSVNGADIRTGTGTPEGAVSAGVGSLFLRQNGGAATTLYVKESGSGNTGWIAK